MATDIANYLLQDLCRLVSAPFSKYWPLLLENSSTTFFTLISVCVTTVICTVIYTNYYCSNNPGNRLEISPDDEVTFDSVVSPEEIAEETLKHTGKKHVPLNKQHPEQHIDSFLGDDHDSEEDEEDSHLVGRVKRAKHEALRKKIEQDMSENDKQTEAEIQSKQLANIYSLLSEHESTFGKMSFEELQGQMSMYKT